MGRLGIETECDKHPQVLSIMNELEHRDLNSLLGRIMPVLVILLWGSATVLSALSLREIGPLAVSFWRWAWALPALWATLFFSRERGQIASTLRTFPLQLLAIGSSGITLLYMAQNLALQRTTVFNVSLFIELTPVFIALLALLVLREIPSWRTWLGIGLGFAGAALLSWNGFASTPGVEQGSLSGDAWALGAAFAGAVYTVYGKKLLKVMSPLMMLTLSASMGVFLLLPMALWEGAFWPQSCSVWSYLLVLGLGAGALGNLWWFKALEHRQAAQLSIILFVTALVAATLAIVIFGDPLSVWLAVGGILILIGARLVK